MSDKALGVIHACALAPGVPEKTNPAAILFTLSEIFKTFFASISMNPVLVPRAIFHRTSIRRRREQSAAVLPIYVVDEDDDPA